MPDTKQSGTGRSSNWFAAHDLPGFLQRAALTASGIGRRSIDGRPLIGICSSWSELVSCNMHFKNLTEAVRRGILEAGGLPIEFPTITLGENLLKPTAMLLRNLMAMDVEESIRAYPFDAVVLLGGCDKTGPAQLMGAASADVPAIMVTGGPANPAVFRGRKLGVGTDLWHYVEELRADRMSLDEFDELEAASMPSVGHCPELGTASTMAVITEALGMSLPGSATIPATDARRQHVAEETGRRAVELARADLRPSAILTPDAFDNAITTLTALGGSTNAVLHLLAIAGRVDAGLTLDRFDEIAQRTPLVGNLRPSGEMLFEDLHHIGGVPKVLNVLRPLLNLDTVGVTGRTLGALLDEVPPTPPETLELERAVLAPLSDPIAPTGGLVVLRGSLAPAGAIIKTSATDGALLQHTGPALVFDGIADITARIDDPDLDVTADTVLVLRGVGPVGGPGMPEWAQLPIPQKLLRAGVTDMVRISDARMSGTAFGTVVLHVAPESAVGGPLSLVRDGDLITLDIEGRRLDLEVDDAELARREPPTPTARSKRGYIRLYVDSVTQADTGCDLDFLVGSDFDGGNLPSGILHGWQGGW
jgi:dihydroxy-acid dehydratase